MSGGGWSASQGALAWAGLFGGVGWLQPPPGSWCWPPLHSTVSLTVFPMFLHPCDCFVTIDLCFLILSSRKPFQNKSEEALHDPLPFCYFCGLTSDHLHLRRSFQPPRLPFPLGLCTRSPVVQAHSPPLLPLPSGLPLPSTQSKASRLPPLLSDISCLSCLMSLFR